MTELSSFLEEILFVIVLYKKKPEQSQAFIALQETIKTTGARISIFLYDNSPEAYKIIDDHVVYRHDPENSGVSKAYNEASAIALKLNKKWMLLLDQDSEFSFSIFSAYHASIKLYTKIHVFAPVMIDSRGVVSPFRLVWGKGIRLKNVNPGIYTFKNVCVINSGMLISLEAFKNAGGFDERFPLDFSDVVFAERLCKNYPILAVINASAKHHLFTNNNNQPIEEVLNRFRIFCKAMKLFKKVSPKRVILSLTVLPRSIKLFLRYKTTEFLKTGIFS